MKKIIKHNHNSALQCITGEHKACRPCFQMASALQPYTETLTFELEGQGHILFLQLFCGGTCQNELMTTSLQDARI